MDIDQLHVAVARLSALQPPETVGGDNSDERALVFAAYLADRTHRETPQAATCAARLVDELPNLEQDWVAAVAATVLRDILRTNEGSEAYDWAVEGLGVVGVADDVSNLISVAQDATKPDAVRADAAESAYLLDPDQLSPSIDSIVAEPGSYLDTALIPFRILAGQSRLLSPGELRSLNEDNPEELIRYLDGLVLVRERLPADVRASVDEVIAQCATSGFAPSVAEAARQYAEAL